MTWTLMSPARRISSCETEPSKIPPARARRLADDDMGDVVGGRMPDDFRSDVVTWQCDGLAAELLGQAQVVAMRSLSASGIPAERGVSMLSADQGARSRSAWRLA
jgi:hypothetical protein